LWTTQKLNCFRELVFRLVNAGYIVEADSLLTVVVSQLKGAAATETRVDTPRGDRNQTEGQNRQSPIQNTHEHSRLQRPKLDRDVVFPKELHYVVLWRRTGDSRFHKRTISPRDRHCLAFDLKTSGAACFGERIELRIINALHLRLLALICSD
jgi:hypothetical protein